MIKSKFELIGKTLYFPKEKILTIGDLHFGYEEELSKNGINIPKRQVDYVIKDLERVVKKIKKVEKIVILGDIRHSFGKILREEKEDMKKFFDFLRKSFGDKELIVTKGNHDTMLEIMVKNEKWKNVYVNDYFLKRGILFFHGDYKSFKKIEKIKKEANLMILGHYHPAVSITDGEKVERFKCFLVGKLNRKKIVVVPSFFPLVEGANILAHAQLKPNFVKRCKVFVVDSEGKVYDWGMYKKNFWNYNAL